MGRANGGNPYIGQIVRQLDTGPYRGLIGRVFYEMSNGLKEVNFILSGYVVIEAQIHNVETLPKDTPLTNFDSEEYKEWIAIHGPTPDHCNKCGLPNLI